MGDLLVLWDLDGTLLDAGGAGSDLYAMVFLQLFGRPLDAHAPMAGRTDRAIILETLDMAGISEPRRHVDPFIEGLRAQAPAVRELVALRGRALPGAATALTALAAASRWLASSPRGLPLSPCGPPPSAYGPAPSARGPEASRWGRTMPNAPEMPRLVDAPGRVHQSVLTGNIRTVAEVKLSALGLREGLDLCIGAYGDDHEVRAELVHVARRRAAAVHGRLPTDFGGAETVVIGDTPLDVEAALATGARAVGVATGRYSVAELASAGADVVLPDLTDTRLLLDALLPQTTPSWVPAPAGTPPVAMPSRMVPAQVRTAQARTAQATAAQATAAQATAAQATAARAASSQAVPH